MKNRGLLVSADAASAALGDVASELPAEAPPLPPLGYTVIVTVGDPNLVASPLIHLPAIVTNYMAAKGAKDHTPTHIEATAIVGQGAAQFWQVATPQGPRAVHRLESVVATYSKTLTAGTWRWPAEHAEIAGVAVVTPGATH
jgi:hypothetical protein